MDLITRIPPNDQEAEQAVLASMLVDIQAIAQASSILEPSSFYRSGNGIIFAAMMDLHRKGEPVDLLTVKAHLGDRLDEVGGYGYLLDLQTSMPTTAHVETYARTVAEKAARRATIKAADLTMAEAFNPEVEDPIARAQSRFMALGGVKKGETCTTFSAVVDDEYGRIIETVNNRDLGIEKDLRAFEFGLPSLDYQCIVMAADMVTVGARPSAGKTSFGLQVADHVATTKPVLFFSLEMTKQAIARRYFALKTGVSVHRQITGILRKEEQDAIAYAMAEASFRNMEIDDRVGLTVAQMQATALRRQHANGQPWGLILVDHMVKVKGSDPRANGHQKLTQVSNDLKELGRNMGVPVMVLTQLRRPAQGQEKQRPYATDLRESGSIEEDSDIILLLHRPDRDQMVSAASLYIEKQRNGPCGELAMTFKGDRMMFECQKSDWSVA